MQRKAPLLALLVASTILAGCIQDAPSAIQEITVHVNVLGMDVGLEPSLDAAMLTGCIKKGPTLDSVAIEPIQFEGEECSFPPPILILPEHASIRISTPSNVPLQFQETLKVEAHQNQTHWRYEFMMPETPMTFQYEVDDVAQQMGLVFLAIPESRSQLAQNTLYAGHFHSNLVAAEFDTNIAYQCRNTVDFTDCIVAPPFEPDLFLVNGRPAPSTLEPTQPALIINHGTRVLNVSGINIEPGQARVIESGQHNGSLVDSNAPAHAWWGSLPPAILASTTPDSQPSWNGQLLPNLPAVKDAYVKEASTTLNPGSYQYEINLPYSCAVKSIDMRIIPDRPGGSANLDAYDITVKDRNGNTLTETTTKRGDPWIYEWSASNPDAESLPQKWIIEEQGEGGLGYNGSWTAIYETRWDFIFQDPEWFNCLMQQVA